MAALRGFGRTGEQVDPFNAGEPELPWEEPDAWDATGESGASGEKDDAAEIPQVDYAPHGSTSGSPHKRADGYQAPTTRGGSYDAPSTDEAPTGEKGAKAAPKRHRKGGGCSGCGCVFAIVVVALTLGAVAVGISTSVLDSGGSLGDDSNTEVIDTSDASDQAALDAAGAQLDGLLADPSSGELHDALAAYLDQRCIDRLGLTSADLGIDTSAWATTLLGQVSWTPDEGFTYSDGTGSAWIYLSCPSAYEAFDAFYDEVWQYLYDQGLFDWGEPVDAALTDAQRAEVARLLQTAQTVDVSGIESLECFDVTYESGAWVADDNQLLDALRSGLEIYY